MFSDAANLGGVLDSSNQLKVSDVVHKAVIEIDEKGSEAAGATGKYIHDKFDVFYHFMSLIF